MHPDLDEQTSLSETGRDPGIAAPDAELELQRVLADAARRVPPPPRRRLRDVGHLARLAVIPLPAMVVIGTLLWRGAG